MQIIQLPLSIASGPDKQIEPVLDSSRRKLAQITLRNQATLAAHKVDVPITILCLTGMGTLSAGNPLTSVHLTPGTLVTLEPSVLHQVVAEPEVSFLLTRYVDK